MGQLLIILRDSYPSVLVRARACSVPHESSRIALSFVLRVKISGYWESFFNGDLARPLTRLSETPFVPLRAIA